MSRGVFNWRDFIDFSEYLLNSINTFFLLEEAVYRSICSRSYYGAFKTIEDYLKNKNLNIPTKDSKGRKLGSHQRVIYFFHNKSPEMSRKLKRLKALRVKSDYNSKLTIKREDSYNSIKLAREIIEEFDNFLSSF